MEHGAPILRARSLRDDTFPPAQEEIGAQTRRTRELRGPKDKWLNGNFAIGTSDLGDLRAELRL